MPTRRFSRAETIRPSRQFLDALRIVRQIALEEARPLRPAGEVATEINRFTDAIDRLAGVLTGDPSLFHAGGSVAPHGLVNGVKVGE